MLNYDVIWHHFKLIWKTIYCKFFEAFIFVLFRYFEIKESFNTTTRYKTWEKIDWEKRKKDEEQQEKQK